MVSQHLVSPGGGSKPALDEGRARRPLRWSTRIDRDAPSRASLADYFLYCDADVPLLFTENETNNARLFGSDNASPYVKDGINNFVVHGDATAVNPAQRGNEGGGPLPDRRRRRQDAGHPAAADDARSSAVGPAVRRFRCGVRGAAERGRCVLRLDHARRRFASDPDRANVMRQALAGMLWTKQYFYYDLDLWLDEHGAGAQLPQQRAPAGAQQRVGPHVQRRHHLDAGQVGIPVVCRVGSGVPHDPAGHGRPRLRQAAARPDAAQRLPASERPVARLRVELRRRQSAGACVGDDAALPVRPGASGWQGRYRVSQVRVFQAAGQFHLVGQPQGSRRRQRLRGRLSRTRQHRRIRPFVAAAHGRLPRPGRRHGVDGVLQPADAAHRGRARTA